MGDFVVVVLNSQCVVFLLYASLTTLVFMFYTKKNVFFLQKSLSNTFFSNIVCLKIFFAWNVFYWR